MKKFYFSEIATIGAGQGAPQASSAFVGNGYPFIRAGSLQSLCAGESLDALEKINDESAKKHRMKLYPAGTIVFAKSGMSATKDRVFVLPDSAYVVNHLSTIDLNRDIADPIFVRYFWENYKPSRLIKDDSYPSISAEDIENVEISLPPLTEQKRVVSLLAHADRLRQLRRTAHDLGDALLQSVFLEMFGDPVRNEMGWEGQNLNELCRNITDGTHDTPDRTDSGVPFITSKNIRPYEIDLSVLEYVSEETHQEIIKRTNPQYGDVIYTNIGANLGNAAMNKLPFSFSLKNVALLQPNGEVLNSYYLEALLNNERFKNNLIYLSSAGGAQKFITLEVLRSISIPYPPISVQEKFAAILESYQRMLAQQVESERQIETLFQDLLSQAFESHV